MPGDNSVGFTKKYSIKFVDVALNVFMTDL